MIAEIKAELKQILIGIGYPESKIYGKPKLANPEKEHAVISVVKEKFSRNGQVLSTEVAGADDIRDTTLDYTRTQRLVVGLICEKENDTSDKVHLFLTNLPGEIAGVNNTTIKLEAIDAEYVNHSNATVGVVEAWILVEAKGEVQNVRVRQTGAVVDHETIVNE